MPPLVEVTRHASADGSFECVGLVKHSARNGTAFHKPIAMSNTRLQLRAKRKTKNVRICRAQQKPDISVTQNGWVEYIVPKLERFEVALFE